MNNINTRGLRLLHCASMPREITARASRSVGASRRWTGNATCTMRNSKFSQNYTASKFSGYAVSRKLWASVPPASDNSYDGSEHSFYNTEDF